MHCIFQTWKVQGFPELKRSYHYGICIFDFFIFCSFLEHILFQLNLIQQKREIIIIIITIEILNCCWLCYTKIRDQTKNPHLFARVKQATLSHFDCRTSYTKTSFTWKQRTQHWKLGPINRKPSYSKPKRPKRNSFCTKKAQKTKKIHFFKYLFDTYKKLKLSSSRSIIHIHIKNLV